MLKPEYSGTQHASTNRFGARIPALVPRSPPLPEFRAGRATRRRVRPSRPLVGVRYQAAPAPGTLNGERIISGRPARTWPGAIAIKTRTTGRTFSRTRPGLTSWPGRRSTSRPAGAPEAQGTQGRNARWRRGERTLIFSTMARPSIRRQPTRLSSTAGRSSTSRPGRYVRDPRFCHGGSKDHGKIRLAESPLRNTENPPIVSDVIRRLGTGKTASHRYFPPEPIRKL